MGTTFEWMTATEVGTVGYPQGTVIGADVVEHGNAVVLQAYGNSFALVIEGTPADLHALARRILDAAVNAGEPVIDVLTGEVIDPRTKQ